MNYFLKTHNALSTNINVAQSTFGRTAVNTLISGVGTVDVLAVSNIYQQ